MLTDLLDGTLPNLQDIMLIQSSILEARDIYQPWRLGKQLLETKDLEVGGCCCCAGPGGAPHACAEGAESMRARSPCLLAALCASCAGHGCTA